LVSRNYKEKEFAEAARHLAQWDPTKKPLARGQDRTRKLLALGQDHTRKLLALIAEANHTDLTKALAAKVAEEVTAKAPFALMAQAVNSTEEIHAEISGQEATAKAQLVPINPTSAAFLDPIQDAVTPEKERKLMLSTTDPSMLSRRNSSL